MWNGLATAALSGYWFKSYASGDRGIKRGLKDQCFALNVASLRETFFFLPRRTRLVVESGKDFFLTQRRNDAT